MGILDGIKKAFKMLPELASSVGALVLTVIIMAMVAGVFIYQAVTAGNINVDTTSSNLISGQSGNFSAIVDTIWSAAQSVAGFIVIGVIALIAVAILGRKFLGGGSKL